MTVYTIRNRISRTGAILLAGGLLGLTSVKAFAASDDENEMEKTIETTRRIIVEKETMLLSHINHEVFAAEARRLASNVRWGKGAASSEPNTYLRRNDPALPEALLVLRPTSVRVWDDRIEVEFGGALYYFGIRVFREGVVGEGTKEVAKGIWFYSQDNKLPSSK